MKFATIVLLGVLLLASFPSMMANDRDPAGASEVAIAFTGGSVWTSGSTGICVWYLPLVGDLKLESLFSPSGAPVADREHAHLIWVSDFSVVFLPANGSFTLALAPAGTATIYFKERPELRDWSDLTDRSTWGEPVAKFVRKAGLVQSPDSLKSDTFIFSADLASSKTFTLNGKPFNFKNLIPHGMTCIETGGNGSSLEAGTCLAIGGGF
jgi:hypothetical protein